MLFPDVANCMQTDDLELKKLVYLYLTTYARSSPDLAIMAVNTFVKDAADPNPLVRALAIRTMGCIRVDRIVEYLCDPLGRALKVSEERREGRADGWMEGAGFSQPAPLLSFSFLFLVWPVTTLNTNDAERGNWMTLRTPRLRLKSK